ncbi:uncharacterized protein LOC117177887 isoform X2 [Belonocnema kinseyi]|uniref:uncharacterized protein LOC117177887 isoform X2 n=1 Tax=Belonocnema kinseyi TaxID=2817044 RepID=UPI00143E0280|nr:uncharacterized protein LOC117177887 isoform X2 [Belonocnema kinseyi]
MIELSDSENSDCDQLPECRRAENGLPKQSMDKYLAIYNQFMEWKNAKHEESLDESLLLTYFNELAEKLAPSTLWSRYSMLKSTLNSNDNVDIAKYSKLSAFLKRQATGFVSKKSKTLTSEQIAKFLTEAPDHQYLVTKVALIFGVTGALRKSEMCEITTKDIKDYGSHLLITIPKSQTHIQRTFTVDGDFYYSTYKKYEALRPKNLYTNRFFLNYQNGKCTHQVIGKNKFGSMPKKIAEYLNLPEPELYTGHSFRRTSATLLTDSGADITTVKRHGGFKTSQNAEGHIEDSMRNKRKICQLITKQLNINLSTGTRIFPDCPPPKRYRPASVLRRLASATSGRSTHELPKGSRNDSQSQPTQNQENNRTMGPQKIIIDCDAGTDDALALILLIEAHKSKEIEIMAITCTAGNTTLENVIANVFRTLNACNALQIPVFKGAHSSLLSTENAKVAADVQFHGSDGFGDVFTDKPDISQLKSEHAVCALQRIVSQYPGEVSIIGLAPLTSIALTIKMYPDFAENVNKFYVMGGNYSAMGNVTPQAEFNFYADPESAHIVLSSSNRLWLLPWETCLKSKVSNEWRKHFFGKIDTPAIKLLNAIEDATYSTTEKMLPTYTPCDAFLAGIVLRPEMATSVVSYHIDIELGGTRTRGQVVIDHFMSNEQNAFVIQEFDSEVFKEILLCAANPAKYKNPAVNRTPEVDPIKVEVPEENEEFSVDFIKTELINYEDA